MADDPDSEEKIAADMSAVIRRAIALGQKRERERVQSVLFQDQAALQDQAKPKAGYVINLKHARDEPGEGERPANKYPYGFVADHVRGALKAHAKGITADQVVAYVKARADIDETSIRQTLKSFKKRNAVTKSGLEYVPTPSL